jgi:hypothetical protein
VQRASAALLIASACTAHVPPLRSTVTVARTRKVVVIVDDLNGSEVRTCSEACTNEECMVACPTAVASSGACTAPDTTHALCRTFVDEHSYERDGGCKAIDDEPGIRRTSCVDNVEERKQAGRAAKRKVNRVAGIILIPVAVVLIILALV